MTCVAQGTLSSHHFCSTSFSPGAKPDLSGSVLLNSEQGGSHLGGRLPPENGEHVQYYKIRTLATSVVFSCC